MSYGPSHLGVNLRDTYTLLDMACYKTIVPTDKFEVLLIYYKVKLIFFW